MKRVYCLYRVSTLKQIEGNDIPMQKQACYGFVSRNPDWDIRKEFIEKGISGFKVSAKDRDAIQDLQKAVIKKEFDILLVFMFDRIGRRKDETPFLVEWFVQNGIEVWSVEEGQQRFDNHVDKLLNYIRYWQASGESIKTSIRIKTRMEQIVKEGRFKGGVAPYGYNLEHLGRISKKGHGVCDLVVNKKEAKVVELIFDQYSKANMGSQTIATFLTSKGILNRVGNNFVSSTIRNMLKNPVYRGVLRSGSSMSEPFDHLRIIGDETYFQVQDLMEQRSKKNQKAILAPTITSDDCLLRGKIYCGHCGGRLVVSTAGRKQIRKDGTARNFRYWRYLCYNYTRHKGGCCGQSGYAAKRIDEAVIKKVNDALESLDGSSIMEAVSKSHEAEMKILERELTAAKEVLQKRDGELRIVQKEITGVIGGSRDFEPRVLSKLHEDTEIEWNAAQKSVFVIEKRMEASLLKLNDFRDRYKFLVDCSDIFYECEMSVKNEMLVHLIDQITVSRDYNVEIVFTLFMANCLKGVECCKGHG